MGANCDKMMMMMMIILMITSTCKWSMKTKARLHNPVNSGRRKVAPADYHLYICRLPFSPFALLQITIFTICFRIKDYTSTE